MRVLLGAAILAGAGITSSGTSTTCRGARVDVPETPFALCMPRSYQADASGTHWRGPRAKGEGPNLVYTEVRPADSITGEPAPSAAERALDSTARALRVTIGTSDSYETEPLRTLSVNGPMGRGTVTVERLAGGFDHLTDGRLVSRRERLPSGGWLLLTGMGTSPHSERELVRILSSLIRREGAA